MPSVNTVIIAGNLTRDPELRYTETGKAVCDMGLAINSAWTSESGEKKERVTFVDVTVWGVQAENVSKYLGRGSPCLVEGRLQLDRWEHQGENRQKLTVVAESVQFLSSAPGAGVRS